jgi:hypothetical protein
MNKVDIDLEVDKTLSELDEVRPAKAKRFFYTRLLARMRAEESSRSGAVRSLRRRLVLATAAVAALVVINIVTLVHLAGQRSAVARENNLATFAEQYNFTSDQY